MSLENVARAIADIRAGRMVILVDDEDRENEGDLCMAAEKVTPEAINFMITHARGLVCLTLTEERIKKLDLPMMVTHNTSPFETAFTVSVEARHGVSTGISAADRAHTIRVAVAPDAKPEDLSRPGHVFPLRAREGGVLLRTGQTEGSVDMSRLAGLYPAGVICEIIKEDGSMARRPDLEAFAQKFDMRLLSIADLIQYRLAHESLVRRLVQKVVRHPVWGEVTVIGYGTTVDDRQHLAVIKGDLTTDDAPLVRMHSGYPLSNVLGDVFSSDRAVLNAALRKLGESQRGVLVCLDQGQPPVSLERRIEMLGEAGEGERKSVGGTVRELGVGAQILRDLGLTNIRLLVSKPKRYVGLEAYGLNIVDEVVLDADGEGNVGRRFEVVSGGRHG